MKTWLVLAVAWPLMIAGTPGADAAEATAAQRPGQAGAVRAHAGGIWKAAVPAKTMDAEFDRYDVYGLAVGARIQADCSLNWVDPDDGRRYCFASGTSLVYFLDRPKTHLAQARSYWRRLQATGDEGMFERVP